MATRGRDPEPVYDAVTFGIVEDFGVGRSSLTYLQRSAARLLKIDRSFVGGLTQDRGRAAIVKIVTELGHSLGMTVAADGVGDQATWDALALGCDSAQGHFVARPMVSGAIVPWMAQTQRTTSNA